MLVEQREVVLVGIVVDEPLHRADAERAVAQDRDRARCPSRARRTARTPRPRAGTACPRGSPTADARRAAACRSPAARRRRPSPRRGTSRSTSTRMRPTTSSSPSRERVGRARRGSVPAGTPVPGGVHRHVAQRARRATAGDGLGAARRHRPHLGAGRVDARDVAVLVVVVGARPSATASSSLVVVVVVVVGERSRSSSSTSSRSGSNPSPISRARNSGTVGSRSCGLELRDARTGARGTRRRCGRGTRPPRWRAARPAPSRRAR